MHAAARRSSSSAPMPSSGPFSPAPSSFLLLFLLISPSTLPSAAAADGLTEDATTAAWSLMQRPTLSLLLPLGIPEETKAQSVDGAIDLPLPRATERGASRRPKERTSAAVGGRCSYTVTIKTSCSSPRITRDAVSLTFGDANHNEVYASRLDDPASGTFERCSVDTFRIAGPCGGRTCYLYLRRYGRDGWTPEYVKVFYSPGDPHAAVTFYYKVSIPYGVWYGFNLCHGAAVDAIPATHGGATADDRNDGSAAATTEAAATLR